MVVHLRILVKKEENNMKTLKIYNNNIAENQLEETVKVLKDGGVVIIPTDTIYAITCDALNSKAIEKVCKIKGINPDKTNLSILCSDISMASDYAKFDNYAFKLLKDNTPGPFTFLFRATSSLPRAFKGRKTVGVRIPDNNAVKDLVESLGNPLLTTSIPYQDEDYGRNPELIRENLKDLADLMIEGEDGNLMPSAIVDCTGVEPDIIREGPLPLKS